MLGELGKYYQHMKLDYMRHSSKITEIDSALLEMTKGNGCRVQTQTLSAWAVGQYMRRYSYIGED